MKYLLLSILIFYLPIISCSQENNFNKIKEEYMMLINEKRWDEAEKYIEEIMKKYPSSPFRENYYYNLDQILSEHFNEINIAYRKTNPPDTNRVQKGVIILILSENLGSEANRILNKEIFISKNYIKEFPKGKYQNYFLSTMLGAYRLLGNWTKAVKYANEFYDSDIIGQKLIGAWTLAMFFQSQSQYSKAIQYHLFIANNDKDIIEKIKHTYYISICYYEIGDLNEAKKYLKRVFELSKTTSSKTVENIARITWDYIDKYEINSQIPKKHFVIFKGVNSWY